MVLAALPRPHAAKKIINSLPPSSGECKAGVVIVILSSASTLIFSQKHRTLQPRESAAQRWDGCSTLQSAYRSGTL